MNDALRRIRRVRTLAEASLLRDTLQAAGVDARLRGEHRGGIIGEIPIPDAMVEVWVPGAQWLAAEGVLAGLERADATAPWRCGCGEENPGSFDLCWSCGRDRLG